MGQKKVRPKKVLVQKRIRLKKLGPKNFGSKMIWGPKNCESNKFWVQEFLVKWSGSKNKKSKKFWNLPLELGQNLVNNGWDKEKCHQDKNVDWTNITITVGIC